MGDKLNDNNPGIADLSDPNRSTKVAEKYNSLYDNEWTDASESLSFHKIDEEAGVRYLLEIKKVGIIYLNVYISHNFHFLRKIKASFCYFSLCLMSVYQYQYLDQF